MYSPVTDKELLKYKSGKIIMEDPVDDRGTRGHRMPMNSRNKTGCAEGTSVSPEGRVEAEAVV